MIKIDPNHTGKVKSFVGREPRRPESIPGQDEELRQRVEVMLPFTCASCSIRHRFTSRRAASSASSGVDGVRIQFLVEQVACLRRFCFGIRTRRPASAASAR